MDLEALKNRPALLKFGALVVAGLLVVSCQGKDLTAFRQKMKASMGIKGEKQTDRSVSATKLALEEDAPPPEEKGRARLMRETDSGGDEPEKAVATKELEKDSDVSKSVRPTVAGIAKCPEGTTLAGAAPPQGLGQWCERNGGFFGRSVRIGPFMRWHPNGARSVQGNFVNGKPDGLFINWYPDGRKAQETGYKNGLLQGTSVKYNKEGKKIFEGTYNAGTKHGRFHYFTRSGSPKSEGSFRNNIKDGLWTIFNQQGKPRSKITFRDGKKEGRAELFYPDGMLQSSGAYQDAKPTGMWVSYFRDGGKKSQGSYVNGEKQGVWSFYDRTGAVTRTVTYVEGRAQEEERPATAKGKQSKRGRNRERDLPPRDPPVYDEAEEDFKEL